MYLEQFKYILIKDRKENKLENSFDGIKKLPYELIPVIALDEVVQVLDFGKDKHGANNWKT
ncbi:hypothetical protein LCGC14_3089490, partial [marine sediment metagenome]